MIVDGNIKLSYEGCEEIVLFRPAKSSLVRLCSRRTSAIGIRRSPQNYV